MSAPFFSDLRVSFAGGRLDIVPGDGRSGAVDGTDNLVQALTLRLLIDRGELSALGHPRFGTPLRELLGEPMDRANLELLRRYVRRSLLDDPRVAEVLRVSVAPRPGEPGAVEVSAVVSAVSGQTAAVQVVLNG